MKVRDVFGRLHYLLSTTRRYFKERGVLFVLSTGLSIMGSYVRFRCFPKSKTFTLQGITYYYFRHPYNVTWYNERAVEVPIIQELVSKYQGQRILEVGNVLSHYAIAGHDVVDKYEKAVNVINQDAVDFQPAHPYDLIVSISTLEHVGWDEDPRDPAKIMRAIEHLTGLLAPQGKMVVTLPLGYNSALDAFLKEGAVRFDDQYYLERTSDGTWNEADWKQVEDTQYSNSFRGTSGLLIGTNYAKAE